MSSDPVEDVGPFRRQDLDLVERRLLSDLFAIVEEHAGDAVPPIDRRRVEEAFLFACEHHAGQHRKSGEAFTVHPVAVAKICAGLGLDTETLVAALLHDTVEDTTASLDEVRELFGDEVATLVDGVTRLTGITFTSRDEAQAENYRKMMVAMATDLRVILIKLADRQHNMLTIDLMTRRKQIEKAKETLEIYAPIAHRLGFHAIRRELEDLAFLTLHPRKYREIAELVGLRRDEQETLAMEVGEELTRELEALGITASVSSRTRHFYSIYSKMTEKNREFNEIYDLVVLLVITDTVKNCYGSVGVVHSLWKPLPGQFKDFVAMPKFNMYQALHTTVIGPEEQPLAIRVQTKDMQDFADIGPMRQPPFIAPGVAKSMSRGVVGLQSETWRQDSSLFKEHMDTFVIEVREPEVFVFTPKGEVKSFAQGATPLDFAYGIHTEVGHRCVGAKVNGKIVPLNLQLSSGDIVEILTSKRDRGPSRDWLALVKTTHARDRIKQFFKSESREDAENTGREMLQEHLRKQGLPLQKILSGPLLADVIREMGFRRADDFYVALGGTKILPSVVERRIRRRLRIDDEARVAAEDGPFPELRQRTQAKRRSNGRFVTDGIEVDGLSRPTTYLGRCCYPVPGDGIVGCVASGGSVTVHKMACPNAQRRADDLVRVGWDGGRPVRALAEIRVDAWDRRRLLEDLSQALHLAGVPVAEVTSESVGPMVHSRFIIEVEDLTGARSAIARIRAVDSVFDVQRV